MAAVGTIAAVGTFGKMAGSCGSTKRRLAARRGSRSWPRSARLSRRFTRRRRTRAWSLRRRTCFRSWRIPRGLGIGALRRRDTSKLQFVHRDVKPMLTRVKRKNISMLRRRRPRAPAVANVGYRAPSARERTCSLKAKSRRSIARHQANRTAPTPSRPPRTRRRRHCQTNRPRTLRRTDAPSNPSPTSSFSTMPSTRRWLR